MKFVVVGLSFAHQSKSYIKQTCRSKLLVFFRKAVKEHQHSVLDLDQELELLKTSLETSKLHRHTLLASLRNADWNMHRVAIEGHAFRGSW
jgi:hypothetical protein